MARLFTRVRACQVHYTTAIQAAGDPVFCVSFLVGSGVTDHCHDGGLPPPSTADKKKCSLIGKETTCE